MSLQADDLKICPYCEQMLKVHYRYCIRCGQLYPVKSIQDPADSAEAEDVHAEDAAVAQSAGKS